MDGGNVLAIILLVFGLTLILAIHILETRRERERRKMTIQGQHSSTEKQRRGSIGALHKILAEMAESEVIDAMGAMFEQLKTRRREDFRRRGTQDTMVKRGLDPDNAEWELLSSGVEKEP